MGNVDSQDNRPVIGDYVAFGPGAKAFGNISIGSNCFVASNAVVTKSFEGNSVLAGLPAKEIKTNYKNPVIEKVNARDQSV